MMKYSLPVLTAIFILAFALNILLEAFDSLMSWTAGSLEFAL